LPNFSQDAADAELTVDLAKRGLTGKKLHVYDVVGRHHIF
jgi:hypothetical protein